MMLKSYFRNNKIDEKSISHIHTLILFSTFRIFMKRYVFWSYIHCWWDIDICFVWNDNTCLPPKNTQTRAVVKNALSQLHCFPQACYCYISAYRNQRTFWDIIWRKFQKPKNEKLLNYQWSILSKTNIDLSNLKVNLTMTRGELWWLPHFFMKFFWKVNV